MIVRLVARRLDVVIAVGSTESDLNATLAVMPRLLVLNLHSLAGVERTENPLCVPSRGHAVAVNGGHDVVSPQPGVVRRTAFFNSNNNGPVVRTVVKFSAEEFRDVAVRAGHIVAIFKHDINGFLMPVAIYDHWHAAMLVNHIMVEVIFVVNAMTVVRDNHIV